MSKFVPRKSAPSATDKHWIKNTCGGLNECLKISGNSCLPNCVGYAWGRVYELIGTRPKLITGNAENWYDNTTDGYKRSDTPKLGAVACWRKGKAFDKSDGYGHVAIVEEIKPNGDIVCSNSAYGGTRFYMKTYSKSAGYNSGALTFQGFILLPVEFEESSAPKKSVDELANEVIRGVWGNGADRERRLTMAGYDYDEVQARVNEILSVPTNNKDKIAFRSKVTLNKGATDYYGTKLAPFVYERTYIVTELVRDRAVISYGDDVVAAVNVKDLRKV